MEVRAAVPLHAFSKSRGRLRIWERCGSPVCIWLRPKVDHPPQFAHERAPANAALLKPADSLSAAQGFGLTPKLAPCM